MAINDFNRDKLRDKERKVLEFLEAFYLMSANGVIDYEENEGKKLMTIWVSCPLQSVLTFVVIFTNFTFTLLQIIWPPYVGCWEEKREWLIGVRRGPPTLRCKKRETCGRSLHNFTHVYFYREANN